jgi:hypothetical protein
MVDDANENAWSVLLKESDGLRLKVLRWTRSMTLGECLIDNEAPMCLLGTVLGVRSLGNMKLLLFMQSPLFD